MTQADSVHSTPPTNTSPTRRNILGTIAGAGAVALTLPPARAAALGADPIYAAIERHKAASAVWDAAITIRAKFQDASDESKEQADKLQEAADEAWGSCEQAAIDLINTEPTTLAGIVAAIRYCIRQMADDGTFMPHGIEYDNGGDAQETMGWIDAWLDTLADAVAELDRAGKAVQS
jgi:hypothetical protein